MLFETILRGAGIAERGISDRGGINFSRNSFSPSPGDVVAECRH